jgi:GNAT superfamily N-acetyltransferase
MNGRDLTLSLVAGLAVGAALGRRGSRATAPFVSQHGPYTITVMFQPAAPGKRNASGRAEATLNGSEIGEVVFEDYGRLYVQWSSVDKDHRRQGLASAMYDAIERATRLPLTSGDIASSLGALGLWIKRGKLTREQALERYGEWVSRDDEFLEGSEGYEEMMDTARRALRGSRATDPTSTPAFRRWFGASKVVDAEGRPLVVYHGSRSSKTFEVFRGSRRGWYGSGMYFTPDRDFAEGYAEDSDGNVGHLVSVYLRMERPYRYESRNFENKEFVRRLLSPRSAAAVLSRSDREGVGPGDSIRKALVARGYDGIIANNPDGTEYIVFEPTQIKSVDNRGTFDPTDPRISFNRGVR